MKMNRSGLLFSEESFRVHQNLDGRLAKMCKFLSLFSKIGSFVDLVGSILQKNFSRNSKHSENKPLAFKVILNILIASTTIFLILNLKTSTTIFPVCWRQFSIVGRTYEAKNSDVIVKCTRQLSSSFVVEFTTFKTSINKIIQKPSKNVTCVCISERKYGFFRKKLSADKSANLICRRNVRINSPVFVIISQQPRESGDINFAICDIF